MQRWSILFPRKNPVTWAVYEVTQMPADRWSYKTPSLRNIALTAPYMHNGSMSTLRQVIAFYNQGGIVNENLDPLIKPLHLSRRGSRQFGCVSQHINGRITSLHWLLTHLPRPLAKCTNPGDPISRPLFYDNR